MKRLDALAFGRREWAEPAIRRFHEIRREKGDAAVRALDGLYQWMFVPFSLWPLNIHDVFESCLARISSGKPPDREMLLLLEILPAPPGEEVCAVVARHEHDVRLGRYEELVKTTAKFDATEKAVALDPALKWEWSRIKATWDIRPYCDHKGVIRRTLSAERNLRQSFSVNWKKRAERFQAVFDAFCMRWNLYGMEGDKPLLVKLSVNVTPHGTMIFVPAYWSLDSNRDMEWKAVMELHRVRASKKQGAVLAEGVEQRRAMAEKLKSLDRDVKRLRLRGEKRHEYLCKGLGLVPGTDSKRIARLRKEFA